MRITWIVFLLLLSIAGYAQSTRNVKGHISDSAGNSLPGAVVILTSDADSMALAVDSTAGFFFSNVRSPAFRLRVTRFC